MAASNKNNNNADTEQKPQKSQQQILRHMEEAALTQMDRGAKGLAWSGISAGLDIGFSVLLMTVAITSFHDVFPKPVVDFIVANMYPIGFMFVVLGRSELFTEHTTLAVLPVLQGLTSFKKLLRLWFVVYASNIFGGLVFALILAYFAGTIHFIDKASLASISDKILSVNNFALLVSAMLAGWMMGLLAWLVAAARETISQIVIIFIITAAIGFAGLPHCIVGNIEVAAAMFIGHVDFVGYINFLWPTTLGNALGGVLFVAIIKYNHTARSGTERDLDQEERTGTIKKEKS